jgi:signal transduction histidine kinase
MYWHKVVVTRRVSSWSDPTINPSGPMHWRKAVSVVPSQDVRDMIDRAVFDERERIAKDLSDLVIHRLFAIGLGLQSLNQNPAASAARDCLGGFVSEIDRTIVDLRRSIFSLRQGQQGSRVERVEVSS